MGRLFWKFFAFIWLAQLAAMLGIGGMLWLHHYAHNSPRPEIATHPSAVFMVDSAELALRHGGRAALTELLSRAGPQAPLAVDENGRDLLGRPVDPNTLAAALTLQHSATHAPVRAVRLQNNRSLLLFSLRQPFPARMPPPGTGSPDRGPDQPAFLPLTPLLMALLASLAFAAALAWYFARPIRTLRSAFDALAQGKLEVRIAAQMGKRRDELADLGHDFDRMAEQLQALMSGQQRLLHDVSHEMRSPLARLQAAIGLARQQPDRLKDFMTRIDLECERMDKLIGELLALSRLEAGVDTNRMETFPINELLGQLLEDARFEAAASQRDVRLITDAEPEVCGQPELLQRALENVLRNAIRHTPPGSVVEVKTTVDEPQETLRITILDQGPGVAEDELPEIFEPFHRGKSPTDGYGLGLAIARRVLEMHGGTIRAQNRPEGGLRVDMTLPLPSQAMRADG